MLSLFEKLPGDVRRHSVRVAGYAERIYGWALDYGVYPNDVSIRENLRSKVHTLALWHDIGKLMVPREILDKPGKLTETEYREMQKHVEYAKVLYSRGNWPEEIGEEDRKAAMDVSYYHHERWDGGGYLCGYRGEEIPAIARICAIADAFDAIMSPRPYKKAVPAEKAVMEIQANAGTQFDPLLVEIAVAGFQGTEGAGIRE